MRKEKGSKRVLVLADTHCGHLAGLTPPSWRIPKEQDPRIHALQEECWNWFRREVQAVKPIDIVLCLGDTIDGKNIKQGSRELVTADRLEQCDMAAAILQGINAPVVRMVHGTGYHVGKEEDFESIVARKVPGATVKGHDFLDINGVTFDIKHKISSSGIPHGRGTAALRAQLWNIIWAVDYQQPLARIILRGHVHYHMAVSNVFGGLQYWTITVPGLQAAQTIYGGRECDGRIDYGFLTFDVRENGEFTWRAHLADLQGQRAEVEQL